ncbi:MAG: mechanosensitive ion channel [Planctomycetota bacterium]
MGKQIWAYVPQLVGALLILVAGWIVALVVAAVVRAVLRRTSLDDRIAKWLFGEDRAKEANVEKVAGKVVFYLVLVLVLVAFFQALGLTLATEPLNKMLTQILEFVPRLLGAALLLLAAWLVASGMRLVVSRAVRAAKLDERLGKEVAEGKTAPLSTALGNIVYWLVFLLFLPAVLGALELEGLLTPVKAMTQEFLAFLPNVFAAVLIVLLGWFVARLVQRVVSNLLAAAGTDSLSEKAGLAKTLGRAKLSHALGLVVYVLILIPVAIAALNALRLEALTRPTSNMLDVVLGAVPVIFGAALILLFSYLVGRVVAGVATALLAGVGFNSILVRLRLAKEEPGEGKKTPADVAGYVIIVIVMLFAALEAARVLGFTAFAGLVAEFTIFVGQVLLGVLILALGLWLANLAARAVEATGKPKAGALAMIARVAILVLATAVALRQMGLADEIIGLTFGLLLGAAAVAAALAFGIGGRDVAKRKLEEWIR